MKPLKPSHRIKAASSQPLEKNTPIADQLRRWDGRSKHDIEAVFQTMIGRPDWIESLLALLPDAGLQDGATWLLKRAFEARNLDLENHRLEDVSERVFASLAQLTAANAQLHVLQILDRLLISSQAKGKVERFVRRCLESKHRFVVAWAYAGFHALADQHPEYREEALQFLALGLEDGSASIKARIRRLQAKGFNSEE